MSRVNFSETTPSTGIAEVDVDAMGGSFWRKKLLSQAVADAKSSYCRNLFLAQKSSCRRKLLLSQAVAGAKKFLSQEVDPAQGLLGAGGWDV